MRARTPPPSGAFAHGSVVVVGLEGAVGFAELLAGLLLIGAPDLVGALLLPIATELGEGTPPLRAAAARSIAASGTGLTGDALALGVLLVLLGVGKLLLARALLRRDPRWGPAALVTAAVLLAVRVAGLLAVPTAGGAVLAALDALVLVVAASETARRRRMRR